MSETTVGMDFHKGEAVLKLADTYPTLAGVIEEAVQNALDSEATRIDVKLNWRQRIIAIRDNGKGASPQKFQEALLTVGRTMKTRDKLGQFGLGLISPLGKCDYFTFTSCPEPDTNSYREWTMNTDDIRKQSRDLKIPVRRRPDLRCNENGIWWRTQVEIQKFTTDRIIANLDIDDLKANILSRYSRAMFKYGTTIRLIFVMEDNNEIERKFQGDSFTGQPLPEVTLRADHVGFVTFRLFITTRTNRRKSANIVLGIADNDFRLDFTNYRRSIANSGIKPDAEPLEALKSGYFEGEIIGEKLKLSASRTSFEHNEAFMDLSILIADWYRLHGKKIYQQVKSTRKQERYERLGEDAMESLAKILQNNDHSNFWRSVQEMFKFGVKGAPGGDDTIPGGTGPAITNGKPVKPTGSGEGTGRPGVRRKPPTNTTPGGVPTTTSGKDEHKRRKVRGTFGLQLAYDVMAGSNDLWQFDRAEATLTFNTTHPLWAICEGKSDRYLCSLQENVILHALTLEVMPNPDYYQHQRMFSNEVLKLFVAWMHAGRF